MRPTVCSVYHVIFDRFKCMSGSRVMCGEKKNLIFYRLVDKINNRNNMPNDSKLRISSGNKGYYALAKLFKSKLLSRKSKEFKENFDVCV